MAKARSKVTPDQPPGEDVILADGEPLNLRNRKVAAALAWFLPGAGHFYQRRYFKSAIFSISIFSTFLIGMFLAGGRCVYASWNQTEKRWQYILQFGIGLPALPAALQAWGGDDLPVLGGFMAAPKSSAELDEWHAETASGFDMGTLYTMIAGLLNFLVAFDAYAGPLPPPAPKQKRRGKDRRDPGDQPADSGSTAQTGSTASGPGGGVGSPSAQRSTDS
jgi:hypothetical protein